MWWEQLLWGLWHGIRAWIVFIAHVFNAWESHAVYDAARASNWFDFGFLLGAGSPFLGIFGASKSSAATPRPRRRTK
jgi:hypothetical protein